MTHTPTSSGVSAEAEKPLLDDRERMLLSWMYAAFEGSKVGQTITDDLKREMREVNRLVARLSMRRTPPRPSSDTIGGGELDAASFERELADFRAKLEASQTSMEPEFQAALNATPYWDAPSSTASTLAASPPVQEETLAAVAVKPMVWPDSCAKGKRVHADGAGWTYCIVHYGKPYIYRWAPPQGVWSEPFERYEDAQAAAQSDFETRILAALVPLPKPAIEALREAMQQAMDIYQADDERDIGEAMFMVLHTALTLQGGGKL